MGDQLRIVAPAKINLFLKITGQRDDGYHDIATLMQKVDLRDRLTLQRGGRGIRLRCPGSGLPEDETNLAHRAAAHFAARFLPASCLGERGVEIILEKKIPVAAGLGGGSSDAAAVLRGMQHLFPEWKPRREELEEAALSLGADVPFFLSSLPAAWATGIGERLTAAVPLAGYALILVNPGISVSTQWAYENFALTSNKKKYNLIDYTVNDPPFVRRAIEPHELRNDLEPVTAGRHGVITEIRELLRGHGAVAAMMTGSGPTVFGMFSDDDGGRQRAAQCGTLLRQRGLRVFEVQPLSQPGGR